jgi:hypothetical protein
MDIMDIIIYIVFMTVVFGAATIYSKYKEQKEHKEYVKSIKLEKRRIIYDGDLTNKEIEIYRRVIHFIIKEKYLDYHNKNRPVKMLLFDLLTLISLEELYSYHDNMFRKLSNIDGWFAGTEIGYKTLDDYKEKNEADYSIKKYANSFKNAILISCSDTWYQHRNPRRYIKYIEKNFSGIDGVIGFAIFSRIGFDDEKKEAFLEVYYEIEDLFFNDYVFLKENPRKNRFFISRVENICEGYGSF